MLRSNVGFIVASLFVRALFVALLVGVAAGGVTYIVVQLYKEFNVKESLLRIGLAVYIICVTYVAVAQVL